MADQKYNIFSSQLPREAAMVNVDNLTPDQLSELIRLFARKFSITEDQAEMTLDAVAQNNDGYLPTIQNLEQSDVGWKTPKPSSQVFGILENSLENTFGRDVINNSVARWLNPMAVGNAALGVADKQVVKGLDKAFGKHKDTVPAEIAKGAVPYVTWGMAAKPISDLARFDPARASHSNIARTLHAVAGKPTGKFFRPSAATTKWLGRAATGVKTLGHIGTAVDVIGTGVNTVKDIKDELTGENRRRYTEEVRSVIGRNASPLKAFLSYQGARWRDDVVDNLKTALAVVGLAKGGGTYGLLSTAGGTRLHFDPRAGFFMPAVRIDDALKVADLKRLLPGKEGAVARRIHNYKYRNGAVEGLLKNLAGNYFDYEDDHVMNDIRRERERFGNYANAYTEKANPFLYGSMTGDKARDPRVKAALTEARDKYLKNVKVGNSSAYDRFAEAAGADKSTL